VTANPRLRCFLNVRVAPDIRLATPLDTTINRRRFRCYTRGANAKTIAAHYRILRHRPAINAGLEFIRRTSAEQSLKPSEVGEAAAASGPVD
jgi:hypothetical protein